MNYKTVRHDDYLLSAPEAWQVAQVSQQRVALLGPKVGPFRAGVLIDDLSEHPSKLSTLMQREKYRQQQLPMYTLHEEKDISSRDVDTIASQISWYDKEQNIMLFSRQMFVHWGDIALVLTTVVPNSQHAQSIDKVFLYMLNSFRFTEATV